MSSKVFWLVWNINGGTPSYKHETELSARIEAERLARLNPGQEFAVMECISIVAKNEVTWRELREIEVPF